MSNNQQQRLTELQHQSKVGPHQEVALTDIHQLPMYQTRNPSAENAVSMKAIQDKETAMMEEMIADLKAEERHTVDPVTLCNVEGRLVVVDGHHRIDACRRASRELIPARILEATEAEALLLATTLNNHSTVVPQGQEERAEKAWKAMLHHYDGERWDEGWSARRFAKFIGVGSKTMDRMVKARQECGEEATNLTWRQARASHVSREFSTVDKLCGWLTCFDKVNPQSEHELEVFIELIRARQSEYCNREELAERFAALHDDPKAFQEHLAQQLHEF